MEFQDKIKSWVTIDNQVRLYNDRVKQLRSERNEIADTIIKYAHENNLGNAVIEISEPSTSETTHFKLKASDSQ